MILQGISVETSHVLNAFCLNAARIQSGRLRRRDQVEHYIVKYVMLITHVWLVAAQLTAAASDHLCLPALLGLIAVFHHVCKRSDLRSNLKSVYLLEEALMILDIAIQIL